MHPGASPSTNLLQLRCGHWITVFEAGEFRQEAARAGRQCHRARLAVAAAIVFNAALLGACGGAVVKQEPLETSVPTPLKAGRPMELKVLVFNVEYGGGPATDEAIRRVTADVVGVLESYDRLPKIAAATGYPYFNTSLQILSRYPILEPSGGDGQYAFIEVQPGFAVVFCNIHLDYVRYGPDGLRAGLAVEDVIATENLVRTSAIAGQLHTLPPLADRGYPVILTGDFNEPSSLDYTEATADLQRRTRVAIDWPVSEALLAAGFRDSFRDVHPDPVKYPGITFPDLNDRIDFIYASGPTKTVGSALVGEKGDPGVSIGVSPWTSDHRAVVSTFQVTPLALPAMVAVDARLLTVGDKLAVSYEAPGSSGNAVAIVVPGSDPGSALLHQAAPGVRGTLTFDTSGLDSTSYDVVLTGPDGTEIARVSILLRARDARIRLATDRKEYAVGEPIKVIWADGPANRWDWVAIYRASAADRTADSYLIWAYAGIHSSGTVPPSVAGSLTLGPDAEGGPWPLPPGDYVVHYLLADQYESAGSAGFTVTNEL